MRQPANNQALPKGSLMRVLLSTIGSRGDVQPLVALALQLRALGQTVCLCVPPDFHDWIDQPWHPCHTHRSRAAQGYGRHPSDPTLARAPASAGGSHGRYPIRDNRGRSPGLRHHRRSNRPTDRRSLRGRGDGNPLRLRRILPSGSAIATPRATPAAFTGTDAGARNG